MLFIALTVAACIGVPLLVGVLLRLCLRRARPDLLALLAATTLLFLLEQAPVAQTIRMDSTVKLMFTDPFDTFSTWLVAALFVCIVMARIAIPYLIAHSGVRLADHFFNSRH